MDYDRLNAVLAQTLADGHLSRSERRALREVLGDHDLDSRHAGFIRQAAFEQARGAADPLKALDWLEEVLKALHAERDDQAEAVAPSGVAEVWFSPGTEPLQCLLRLFANATHRADICVFTITDNRISEAIERAHRRGVAIRLLTDNDKSWDLGSDIEALAKAGVPVAQDTSDAHMHHKFGVFDGTIVATGSYNWTRSAASENEENLLVTDDPRLVGPYLAEFERLWGRYWPG